MLSPSFSCLPQAVPVIFYCYPHIALRHDNGNPAPVGAAVPDNIGHRFLDAQAQDVLREVRNPLK
ncbi:hypothetical protein D3C73_1415430 [compost metagenome]